MIERWLPNLSFSLTTKDEKSFLRLRTLIWLRWTAIIGQSVAVLYVWYLGFDFPAVACLLIIFLSALLNLWLYQKFPAARRLKTPYVLLTLSYDLIQLTVLLSLTGGLQNPFAFLLLAPVTIAATTQPIRITIMLQVLAFLCTILLIYFHLHLPWYPGPPLLFPKLVIIGDWFAVVTGLVFVSFYLWRVSRESYQMSEALSSAEMILAREQKISALDGLAAAAAHELGTPLSTILLVAKELQNECPDDSPYHEDLQLLHSEAVRCRGILTKLTDRKSQTDLMHNDMSLTELIDEVLSPVHKTTKNVTIIAQPGPDTELIGPISREPIIQRNPGIIYALGNIVGNAIDFAEKELKITAQWTADDVWITIADDGPGFKPDMIERLGEPFVTSRPVGGYDTLDTNEAIGMGLGFFIAKTLLERSGATIEIWNQKAPEKGAMVLLTWERDEIDVGLQEHRASAPYFTELEPTKQEDKKS